MITVVASKKLMITVEIWYFKKASANIKKIIKNIQKDKSAFDDIKEIVFANIGIKLKALEYNN